MLARSPCGQKPDVLVVTVAGETVCWDEGQVVEPQVRAAREQTSMSAFLQIHWMHAGNGVRGMFSAEGQV